jgi:tetratricopeptide (TPR) repeat protein
VKTTVKCERIMALLAALVLLCVLQVLGGVPDSSKVEKLIAQGNIYSEKTFENQKAIQTFESALALEGNNYEVLWHLSRSLVDYGEHLASNTDQEKEKQLQTYEKSLEYANKAIQANPNGAMGYTRRAIANGRIALFKGVWESLDLVKQTRADCEKAIVLDPNDATAYYVLGRTHLKVCEKPRIVRWPLGLGWANMEESIKNFEKSIALRSDFIMYRLDCSRAYIEEDEYAKARQHLTAISTLPTKDEDDGQFRKEAQELLETIKGK